MVVGFVTSVSRLAPLFGRFPGLLVVTIVMGVLTAMLTILTVYAGISLWRVRLGAVVTAKAFLWIYLANVALTALLPFAAGFPAASNRAMISPSVQIMIRGLFYFAVWYSYLSRSKRVRATYADASSAVEPASGAASSVSDSRRDGPKWNAALSAEVDSDCAENSPEPARVEDPPTPDSCSVQPVSDSAEGTTTLTAPLVNDGQPPRWDWRRVVGWLLLVFGSIGLASGLLFLGIGWGELFRTTTDPLELGLTALIVISPLAVSGLMIVA